MSGIANVGYTQDRQEARRQVEAHLLATQLAKLRTLRSDEKRLRAKVALLQKQAVNQGPLHREINLSLALQQEQDELRQLREQLLVAEREIEAEQNLPPDEGLNLKAQRLEERISDLKARRNEARWHQSNVHFLEEKLASQGPDARLDVVNELRLSQEELKTVESQLAALYQRLESEWQLTPAALPNIEEMGDEEIAKYAHEIVVRRERESRDRVEQRMVEGARGVDAMVTALLEELRGAAYPSSPPRTPRYDGKINLSLVRVDPALISHSDAIISQPKWAARNEVSWSLHEPGSFAGVDVVLQFDSDGIPTRFSCQRQGHNPKEVRTATAELDRESLRSALMALYSSRKRWWEVWKSPVPVPKHWS
jgi:hypothetical protein